MMAFLPRIPLLPHPSGGSILTRLWHASGMARPLLLCRTRMPEGKGRTTKHASPTRWAAASWGRRSHMQSWYRPVIVSVLVGSLLLAGPLRWAEAGEPQEKVKVTVDEVVAILANHTLQPPERRTKIRQAVL